MTLCRCEVGSFSKDRQLNFHSGTTRPKTVQGRPNLRALANVSKLQGADSSFSLHLDSIPVPAGDTYE